MPRRSFLFWGWHPRHTEEIEPGVYSPVIARVTFCTPRCTNQPTSRHRDDGLHLENTYIAAAVRCAPPENKPLPKEILNCRDYLRRELAVLRPKVILALGKIAWDAYLEILKQEGRIASRAAFPFAHGAEVTIADDLPRLFGVFHPSQQNTQTGRLTEAMYATVFGRIQAVLNEM